MKSAVGKYLEKYCCCYRKAKIAAEDNQDEASHDNNEGNTVESIPQLPFVDIEAIREAEVKRTTDKFTSDFWPSLLHDLADSRVRYEAATCIQRHARGRSGRKESQRKWREAMSDMQRYWDEIRDREKWEQEKLLHAKRTRQKFASEVVSMNMAHVISANIRNKAAVIIQCWWRGHVARTITAYLSMLSKSLVLMKPKPIPTRFTKEVFRRVYGRKYVPEGGWPGRDDEISYDMWIYKDKPPVGRKYGLKTYKIHAAPQNKKEKEVLLTDKNAWVGIPTSIYDPATIPKPIIPATDKSPYARAVVAPNPDLYKKKSVSVSARLSQMGFQNAGMSNKQRKTMRYSNFEPTAAPAMTTGESTLTMQTRGVRKPQQGVNILDTSQLLQQSTLLQTFGNEDNQDISSQSSVSSFRTQVGSRTKPSRNTLSSWSELKNSAKMISKDITNKSREKAEQALDTRERPWPVKKKKIFKLEYTWIPQPLLHRAANELYELDEEPEDETVKASRLAAEQELDRRKQLFHQVSVMSTLTGLNSIIAEEKRNTKPPKLEHPYHWL